MARSMPKIWLLASAAIAAGAWWMRADEPPPAPRLMATGPPVQRSPSPPASALPASVESQAGASPEPRWRLLGVGTAQHSARELAVLRIDGSVPRFYALGDSVARGARLIRMQPTFIEVDDHGHLLRVPLEPSGQAAVPGLRPLRTMLHGADATTAPTPPPDTAIIARAADAPPPNSTAIGRAIDRAAAGAWRR